MPNEFAPSNLISVQIDSTESAALLEEGTNHEFHSSLEPSMAAQLRSIEREEISIGRY